MGNMLQGASDFNQDIGSWKIDNVTNMSNMLSSSGLSIANYDETLIGWAAQTVKSNVTLGASGLNYSLSEVQRQSLIDDYGWTITDAGSDSVVTIELGSANYSVGENDGSINITYTVTSDVVSTTDKQFIFTITGGTATSNIDYTLSSPITIIITAGDYKASVEQTQLITIINDDIRESNESITLTLESATGEQNVEFGIQKSTLITIFDDDNKVIIDEDVPYLFTSSDFTFTDIENNTLTSVTITDLNLNGGSLTYIDTTSDEIINVIDGMTLIADQLTSLTFTSAADDSTDSSFSYTVNDVDNGETAATMNITVNAVNDAAIVSSDRQELTETDDPLSFTGQLTASDVDNDDDVFIASNIEGSTGTFSIDSSGIWVFTANSAFNSLNVNDIKVETFNVNSIDGTASTVTIQINGSNDTATVTSDSQAFTETNARLTTSGQLTAKDVDNTNNSFTTITTIGEYGTFSIDKSGAWTFTANSAFNTLNVGDNVAETFNITSIDGTASTVAIQINGTNDAATVTSDSQALTETNARLTTSGQLTAKDVDNTNNSFTAITTIGEYGTFSIDKSGAWTFTANSAFNTLNIGDNVAETFNITSIDGTASTVTIQINGSNDVATVTSDSQALTETNARLTTSGQLTAKDVDNTNNSFTAITTIGKYGTFSIDKSGAWTFTANSAFNTLNVGDNVAETFNITSIDGTASSVTIQINGTNDLATVNGDSQVLNETNDPVITSGQLTASDVDNTSNTFIEITTVGEYGTFSIDKSGEWTFTANSSFNTLNVGDNVAEIFNITSIDGTASTVSIQINGSNDAATISSAIKVLNETDLPLSISGQLTANDIDNTDNEFAASTTIGRYGTLSIDASGEWSFTANSAFNALNVGDKITETFDVFSVDGTVSTVTIQINGSKEIETDDNVSERVEEAFDLRPLSNDEDSNSIYNSDINARNVIGLNIDLTVDLTVDILGNQEQDSTSALRDDILLSVLSERSIDNNDNDNDVAQSSLENTQTFLQELTSIWQDNGLETTIPLTTFNADNNSRTPEFLEDLDKMQQDLNASAEQNQIITDLNIGAVTGVGITSAALFVSWLLRGGSLLASLLTAMPAWRSLDVLPILTADESLRNAQTGELDSETADAGAEIDALFEDQSPDHSLDDRFKG